ncbi:hypothetical protein FA95DRAFT_1597671 [Auriscalpium vulgare]|uniref:Uncharacterized protein n=1 Tax=Auriscalpium vulgare TaxID=40419 RepID=A0ACB8RK59_9AGAM|nr:hypothetical protein FA95DRAFT_1597671 [Auriscalpium vulgare]
MDQKVGYAQSTQCAGLSADLFHEIALFLPTTRDVLALSLANSLVHSALASTSLFKRRVQLHGWDTETWEREDALSDGAGPLTRLQRWMRIDHIHTRTEQLFDSAMVDGYFDVIMRPVSGAAIGHMLSSQVDSFTVDSEDFGDNVPPVFDLERAAGWLARASDVLPMIIVHNHSRNIPRLMTTGYRDVFRTALLALIILAVRRRFRDSVWFERAAFSFAVLLPHCPLLIDGERETTPLLHTGAFEYVLSQFFKHVPRIPASFHGEEPEMWIGFHLLVGAFMHVYLREDDPQDQSFLALPRPRAPRIVPELEYYDWPLTAPGVARQARGWLADDARGTPLGGLPRARPGSPWVGYYFLAVDGALRRSMPMRFDLYVTAVEEDAELGDVFQLHGTGADSIGSFTLDCRCNALDGSVTAQQMYEDEWNRWEWTGQLTPWGAVGTWGRMNFGGWWVIWPNEWSDSG